LEGGVGAGTYCAPQNQKCSSIARGLAGGTAGVDSEQDFQSRAHGRLKRWARAAADNKQRDGVFTFHFRTAWVDNGAAFATRVIYYNQGSNGMQVTSEYSKRGLVAGEVVTTDFYDNGTEATSRRPFNDLEVSLTHKETTFASSDS
jgi:hypothetical protein